MRTSITAIAELVGVKNVSLTLVPQTMSTGPNNLFSFQPTTGVSDYQVTVPQVDATYQGDVRG